jgi:hypothetical protein
MGSDKYKGKHKHDEESAENGMNSDKHKGKDKDTTGTTTTTSASPPAPGTGGTNNIHPIMSPPTSAELAAAGPAGSGRGIVTASDGKGNSVIIPDHGAGVTVTSGGPGKLIISNGVESRTVSGIAWTISGASTVAVSKGLGVGRPDTPGSVVVLSPNGTVTGSGSVEDAGKAIGDGIADGLAALGGAGMGLVGVDGGFTSPPPPTSTIQQQ